MSNPVEIPTVSKFIEFVKDIDRICKQYQVPYEMVQKTAELLDDFGWEAHPEMILNAVAKQYGYNHSQTANEEEKE